MPKITLDLTDEQVKKITDILDQDKQPPEKEHDCIFKDDFELDACIDSDPGKKNKAFKKFLALIRVKKYIHDNGLEFKPDWSDIGEYKHAIEFSLDKYVSIYYSRSNTLSTLPYFKDRESAQKVINNCRADLDILRR